jgi:glycogen synthase kinase 3 beta
LIEIIKILGTPESKYISKYVNQFQNDLNLPEIPETKWEKLLSKYKPEPEFVDLISKILVFDPVKRLKPF